MSRPTWKTPVLATGAVIVLLTGCRAAVMAYGADPVTARTNASALTSALEQRFTKVVRKPKFSYARMRIARYALAPSKLVADTAIWTDMRSVTTGAERTLEVTGSLSGDQYTFGTVGRSSAPIKTGDSRHVIRLFQLAGTDDWRWSTVVENAVGTMEPERAADIMRALFLSAERPSAAVRSDYRSAFPRAAKAMGRMFTVDSISTVKQGDGSTVVALRLLVGDSGLSAEFPQLAKYLRKYYRPAKYRYRLFDKAGSQWFDVDAAKSALTLHFRTRGGALQPLLGPARSMPDTLELRADLSAKFGLFTVGIEKLVGEFVHVQSASERGWALRFTKEPEWDLPLMAEQLLNTPLRRPFEGNGTQFRLGFVRGAAGQTLLSRTTVVTVRESGIMRFLGNLGFGAMSDYSGLVEEEENRFLAEAFAALRADIGAMGVNASAPGPD